MALGGTQSPIATEGEDSVDCELSELYERGFLPQKYTYGSIQPNHTPKTDI
jgi:hypothetical protein